MLWNKGYLWWEVSNYFIYFEETSVSCQFCSLPWFNKDISLIILERITTGIEGIQCGQDFIWSSHMLKRKKSALLTLSYGFE